MNETIELLGREVIICHPEKPNGKWALKTEYFWAFPEVQNILLEMGYYVAYIASKTRWHHPSDTDARAELAQYMSERFRVRKKCVIIGMSCGGMQGIYFASKYPELVSCLYLDAPVVNLLSCPGALGKSQADFFDEFRQDMGMDIVDLLGYRNHPLDHLQNLVDHNIPVMLVSGDSDTIVPYDENGKYIDEIYKKNGCTINTVIKKGGDHHPHSLVDNTPIIDFIVEHS
ncbi:MAG: alpha/beta hydrolase [Ruminococcaceae bacterium]|nr:alpha/beta hydrolase [Oscillospiraceae bacterium]